MMNEAQYDAQDAIADLEDELTANRAAERQLIRDLAEARKNAHLDHARNGTPIERAYAQVDKLEHDHAALVARRADIVTDLRSFGW